MIRKKKECGFHRENSERWLDKMLSLRRIAEMLNCVHRPLYPKAEIHAMQRISAFHYVSGKCN